MAPRKNVCKKSNESDLHNDFTSLLDGLHTLAARAYCANEQTRKMTEKEDEPFLFVFYFLQFHYFIFKAVLAKVQRRICQPALNSHLSTAISDSFTKIHSH